MIMYLSALTMEEKKKLSPPRLGKAGFEKEGSWPGNE